MIRSIVPGFLLVAVMVVQGVQPLAARQEEPRRAVHALKFSGNHYIDDATLRAAIATSRSSTFERLWYLRWTPFGEKRFLDETELRRDVLRILLLYRRSGFMEATVDTVIDRHPQSVDVRFRITEGEPVRVSALAVSGVEGIVSPRKLVRRLPLRRGDPFDRLLFLLAADSIQATLANRGYPFAEVFRNFDQDVDQRRATVSFVVDPGPQAVIDSIEVVGPLQVDDRVVRRMLQVQPGDVFSRQALLESQRELYRLRIFEFVEISLADSVPDTLVTVRARVSEGRLRHVQAGFGYGTLDCVRALTSWTARDFLGGGKTLDLSARLSKLGVASPFDFVPPNTICQELENDDIDRRRPNYELTGALTLPYVFSSHQRATLALTAERRSEIRAYLREAVGGSASLTRDTPWRIPVTLSYTLSYGRSDADAVVFCAVLGFCTPADQQAVRSRQLQSTLGLTVIRNRTNSPIAPTRGTRFSVDVRYSSKAIGSDRFAQFLKGVVEGTWYQPVVPGMILATRLRVGAILPPRLTNISSMSDVEVIPTQERFYIGGPNTVRGFRQNELGPLVEFVTTPNPTNPRDTIISPTGGNQLFLANAELRFRVPGLSERIRGAIFVDAGDVFERRTASGLFDNLRVTPGAGLRFVTPLGPIRFDVAYNPADPDPVDVYRAIGSEVVLVASAIPARRLSRFRINFSIGEAF